MQNEWLTPKQLEEEFKIKTATQAKYRMRKEQTIPFYKYGKLIRYNREEINKWIKSWDKSEIKKEEIK